LNYWGIENKYKWNVEQYSNEEFIRFTFPNLSKEKYMQNSYNNNPESNKKPIGYTTPLFSYELNKEDKKVNSTKAKTTKPIKKIISNILLISLN